MLIPSHRHTPADLELWTRLEEADGLHGASLDRLIDRSLNAISEFLSTGPAVVSFSTGKDSTVVAELARRIDHAISVVWWIDGDGDWPDESHKMAALCGAHIVRLPRWSNGEIERESMRRFGTDRRIMGIRAEESASRSISALVHGVSTPRVCRPILHWSSQDVFGALARFGAPVHPSYAMLGGGRWPREHIRVDCIGGPEGRLMGRAEWEREYYGDVLARIAAHST